MKSGMLSTLKGVVVTLAFAAALTTGMIVTGCSRSSTEPAAPKDNAATVYTCPMHPEVRQDKPGRCPKCGMDLVPAQPKPAN